MGARCLKQQNAQGLEEIYRASVSSNGIPKIPYSPKTRKIKQQNLVSSLVEDFNYDHLKHLFSSDIQLENFEIIKVIGRGAFSKVYLVKKHDKQSQTFSYFAMKVLKKSLVEEKQHVTYTMKERQILKELKHPFLVQLHFAFQSPERLFFLLDYVNGGDLYYHIRKKTHFSEKEAKFYGAQILLGIDFLHKHGFIYRDLKTENILLDAQGNAKLTDFGLAKEFDTQKQDLHYTFCGTPQYLAPELLKKEGYNYLVDYWGLGILLYEIVIGKPPYNQPFPFIVKEIVEKPYKSPSSFSKPFQNLLNGLLQKDPSQRLGNVSLGGVESVKSHPFFADLDWDKVYNKEYKPPIQPKVKDYGSTRNIEGVFLEESIRNTPELVTIDKLNKMHFEGFTYNEESMMEAERKNYNLDKEVKNSFSNEPSIISTIHDSQVKPL